MIGADSLASSSSSSLFFFLCIHTHTHVYTVLDRSRSVLTSICNESWVFFFLFFLNSSLVVHCVCVVAIWAFNAFGEWHNPKGGGGSNSLAKEDNKKWTHTQSIRVVNWKHFCTGTKWRQIHEKLVYCWIVSHRFFAHIRYYSHLSRSY